MISIQAHNCLSKQSMQLLVDSHLKELLKEKVTAPRTYDKGSIISPFEEYKKKAENLDAKYVEKYANKNKKLAETQSNFFKQLSKNNYRYLKNILIAVPDDLEKYRNDINTKYGLGLFFDIDKKKQTPFGSLLSEKIFNYKKFRSSSFCAKQMSSLGFSHARCPYCGYMLVEIIQVKASDPKEKNEKALLDLDHFFSKSQNPYLAVSFYNLIPSCHNCNSSYKGDKVFELNTHIHPYKDSFDTYYEFATASSSGITPDKIAIRKRASNGLDYQNHIVFDLEARYNNAKQELLKIEALYEKLWSRCKDQDIELFKDYMLQGFPKSKSDILKFEYAKAKRDILKSVDHAGVFATY